MPKGFDQSPKCSAIGLLGCPCMSSACRLAPTRPPVHVSTHPGHYSAFDARLLVASPSTVGAPTLSHTTQRGAHMCGLHTCAQPDVHHPPRAWCASALLVPLPRRCSHPACMPCASRCSGIGRRVLVKPPKTPHRRLGGGVGLGAPSASRSRIGRARLESDEPEAPDRVGI